MTPCCEVARKERGWIYSYEECGNRSRYSIEYELNGKPVNKTLCKRHYKSVTAWLDRIKVTYKITNEII